LGGARGFGVHKKKRSFSETSKGKLIKVELENIERWKAGKILRLQRKKKKGCQLQRGPEKGEKLMGGEGQRRLFLRMKREGIPCPTRQEEEGRGA